MIWVVAILAIGMLFVGFEMFLIFGVPGYLVKILYFGNLPDVVLIQKMVGGINHNLLLAIPFFMFAAEMMSGGRLAGLLGSAAQALFRRVPGGAGYAAIAACTAFSSVSGSAPATVAALGRIMYRPLVQSGFNSRFSLGLVVSAAETALLIPPSISLIIYGWLTETSIRGLFAAGLFIGIFLALAFAVMVFIEVKRRGTISDIYGEDAPNQVVKGTIWALGMPVIILGGIYSGVLTATESAAISVVYAAFVEAIIFRTLNLQKFMLIAQRTAIMTSVIFILLASGSVIAHFIVISGLPDFVIALMQAIEAGPLLFLLIVNIVFLIAGMFIDPGTAQLVLVPVLFPVAVSFGIDPVHFGLVVGLNVCIAMITPPFGLDIFIGALTLNKPVTEIISGVSPFIVVNLCVLVILTYIPIIVHSLPDIFAGPG